MAFLDDLRKQLLQPRPQAFRFAQGAVKGISDFVNQSNQRTPSWKVKNPQPILPQQVATPVRTFLGAAGTEEKNIVTQGIDAFNRQKQYAPVQGIPLLGQVQPIYNALFPKKQSFSDVTSDALAMGKLGLSVTGLPNLLSRTGLFTLGTSGLLGGGINKLSGGSFAEGAGKGVAITPQMLGITRFSNPLIEQGVGKFAPGIANKLGKIPLGGYLSSSTVRGLGNIPEGAVIDATLGRRPLSAGSAALDFASGFLPGGQPGARGVSNAVKQKYPKMNKIDIETATKAIDRVMRSTDPEYAVSQLRQQDEKVIRELAGDYLSKSFAKGKIEDVAQELWERTRIDLNQPKSMALVGNGQGKGPGPLPWETAKERVKVSTPKQKTQLKGTEESASSSVLKDTKAKQRALRDQGLETRSYDDIISNSDIKVKDKVGLIDYLRTPDRVLKKMGLGQDAVLLRKKYDDYITQLPVEINKITQWANSVPKESNVKIFRYLDGQKVELTPQELKVAKEVRSYLANWADKLNLPKDKRITNYITHIFDRDFIQKEFDPEIGRIIRDRVPGSVYDPFTEQRLGKQGYLEDTWQALDAYVKRATRKYNMDVALNQIAKKADFLEDSQYNYVKSYLDRVNMRPTKIDNLLDNSIKQVVGYRFGQRPTAYLTRNVRQMVYRGTLGLNIGSALRNITQGANTYAKLGEKYTVVGYSKLIKNLATGDDELERVGVLKNDFVQDRSLNATKKFWEKADKGLFYFFEMAEKVNRGAAYYGAKSKALANGASEQEAIEAGKKLVRDTQFTFGSVDTPQLLQSDIAKLLLQFQSFNLKQSEFLGEMVKSKDFAGLVRWTAANVAILYTIGELIGLEPKDMVPFMGVLTGDTKLGVTPPVQLGTDVVKGLSEFGGMNPKDRFGNDMELMDHVGQIGNDLVPFIPGGVQIKKTIDAVGDYQRGYDESRTGRVRFPIQQTLDRLVRGALFGTNKLPEAQAYFDEKRSPLSEGQSEFFKSQDAQGRQDTYTQIINNRVSDKEETALTDKLSESKEGVVTANNKVKYYDSETNSVKSINLGEYDELPSTNRYEKAIKDSKGYSLANQIINSPLSDSEKRQYLDQIGVDYNEAQYYNIASQNTNEKSLYVTKQLDQLVKSGASQEQFLKYLVDLRKSVNGDRIAADGVIDNLVADNYIDYETGKQLKKIKPEVDNTVRSGKVKPKSSKAKKAKVVKPPAFKAPSTTKIKLGKAKIAKVKLGRSKPTAKAKVKVKGIEDFQAQLQAIEKKVKNLV